MIFINNPKISVITICYNEKNIEKTCKSVVNQTFQDFEWIVIDGGSTDDTLDILSKYQDRIDILISEKDNGRYNAMNKGIKLAKGKWLIFMNGGDAFYSYDVLEKVFKGKNYKSDILYGNTYLNDFEPYKRKADLNINKNYFINKTINHQSTFIKKELFDKYGLYNEQYKIFADREKFIVFAQNNANFEYIDECIANYDLRGFSSIRNKIYKKEEKRMLSKYFSKQAICSIEKHDYNFFELLFSVKNEYIFGKKFKVITFLGFKIKLN